MLHNSLTVDALLDELHVLSKQTTSSDATITSALRLLTALVDMPLTDKDRVRALIPALDGILRPIGTVYYDDIRSCHVSAVTHLPQGIYTTHSRVGFDLAKQLDLTFVSHHDLDFKSLCQTDRDMGESLTNRIKGVLLQYSVEQAFSEFFANAADAGAKTFAIMLDCWAAPSLHVLSPHSGELQSHPCLIVYNDSVFKQKDFEGIVDLGSGGKQNRTDTIGQFGLGALSMFHFTDVSGRSLLSRHVIEWAASGVCTLLVRNDRIWRSGHVLGPMQDASTCI